MTRAISGAFQRSKKNGVAHSWDDTVVGVVPECLPPSVRAGGGFGATTGGLPRLFIP